MVTVIIPTYKRPEFIDRAITSVLNQTYNDIELIVVDDNDPNSEDRAYMEKFMLNYKDNKKIKYIKHTKNMNGAAARNTGIKYATGEYISFLDDDDFYLPSRIEELLTCLDNNPDYDAAYTGGFIIKNNKIVDIFKASYEGNLQLEILKSKPIIKTGSNLFIRKSSLKDINGFDEDFFRFQDLEMLIRFFRNHKMKALNSYTVAKTVSSKAISQNVSKDILAREMSFKKYKKDILKYPDDLTCIYVENYKLLLSLTEKKSDLYYYVLNKLKSYNYTPSVLELWRNSLRNTWIKTFFSTIRSFLKCNKIQKKYLRELKYFLKEYNI